MSEPTPRLRMFAGPNGSGKSTLKKVVTDQLPPEVLGIYVNADAALREAILNAVIHKDYATGTPIQISVYADKLMIWNPGQLPPSWTVDKLKGKHSSQPFNPDIANVFFRAGEIEAWGRGIERILVACREAGFPEPEIEYEATGLWIRFSYAEEIVKRIAGGPGEKVSEKMSEKMLEKILAILSVDPKLSLAEVAVRIGKSSRTVERAAGKLVEAGRLKRIGPDKGGRWEVAT